jgi:hypothetical protein
LLGAVAAGVLMLVAAGVGLAVFLTMRGGPAHAEVLPPKDKPADPGRPPIDLPAAPPGADAPGSPAPPDPAAPPANQSVLPPDEQEKVNAAIDHGVGFLKDKQHGDGTWSGGLHATGLAALGGLTLLECGVAADDLHVQNAADYVRRHAPKVNGHSTYQLALSILFLDRLGDAQDEAIIRGMALRLLAGQQAAGGWSYECPAVSDKDEEKLWTVLDKTRPQSSLELIASKTGDKGPADVFSGVPGAPPRPPSSTIPLSPGPSDEDRKQAKLVYDGLSPALKGIPALKPPVRDEDMPKGDPTDNSNTQFATLGLWAAGRHGVPMERALALLAKRFQFSQTKSGGWAYNYMPHPAGGETESMTGAGLLGLAVGHGLTADLKGSDLMEVREDPLVEKGMTRLAEYIAQQPRAPKTGKVAIPANHYFMWSVERVGMLYGRKTIGDQEWYPWGASVLVQTQTKDGSWPNSYEVPTDTCFALLFLKRANLAKDLTTKVQFLTQIKN